MAVEAAPLKLAAVAAPDAPIAKETSPAAAFGDGTTLRATTVTV